jgi:hypothetical protein
MTSPVLRTAVLNSSPGSVDAFKGWQGRRERAWQSHSRDRGRRQAPVCSREREAGLTERAQATTRVPDAPISRIVLDLAGGSKGLLANSETLCAGAKQAAVKMVGQNGAHLNRKTALQVSCQGARRKRHLHRAKVAG